MENQLNELIFLVTELSAKVEQLESQVNELNKPKKRTGNKSHINSSGLSEEAMEAKRKAHREWQRENRDKVKEYTNRYWENKARQISINIEY